MHVLGEVGWQWPMKRAAGGQNGRVLRVCAADLEVPCPFDSHMTSIGVVEGGANGMSSKECLNCLVYAK